MHKLVPVQMALVVKISAGNLAKGKRSLEIAARTIAIDVAHNEAKPFKQIPGPSSLPIIGCAHHFVPHIGELAEFANVPVTGLKMLREKYGPIFKMTSIIGRPDMVFVCDQDDIEKVLRNDNKYPERHSFESLNYFRTVIMKDYFKGIFGLLSSSGEQWRTFRSQVNPVLMHPKTIKLYSEPLSEVATDMVDRLKSLRGDDNKIKGDFELEMNKWALESVGTVALGTRLGCLDPDLPEDSNAHQIIKCVREIFQYMDKLDFQPSLWKIYATSDYKKAVKVYEHQISLSQMYIDIALAEIEEKKKEPNAKTGEQGVLEKLVEIDPKVALVMASDMLFAGVDTAAHTLIGILYLLAGYPDKQEKLRHEIRKNDGDTSYLRACIKEGMRLYPVTGGNLRTSTKDQVIAGYFVPKGINLVFPHEYLSREENQYKMADKFIPERWLVDEDDPLYYGRAHAFTTMPFGYGVRSCVGRRIAELEVEIFLSRMIDTFHVEWDGPPVKRFSTALNYFKNPDHFALCDAR